MHNFICMTTSVKWSCSLIISFRNSLFYKKWGGQTLGFMSYSGKGLGEKKLRMRGGTRTLIWVDSHREKVGAETEAKIKTGAGAGELRPPASGCYYTSIMRN